MIRFCGNVVSMTIVGIIGVALLLTGVEMLFEGLRGDWSGLVYLLWVLALMGMILFLLAVAGSSASNFFPPGSGIIGAGCRQITTVVLFVVFLCVVMPDFSGCLDTNLLNNSNLPTPSVTINKLTSEKEKIRQKRMETLRNREIIIWDKVEMANKMQRQIEEIEKQIEKQKKRASVESTHL